MVKLDHIKHVIELSDGVGAAIEEGTITLSKEGTSLSREFVHSSLSV